MSFNTCTCNLSNLSCCSRFHWDGTHCSSCLKGKGTKGGQILLVCFLLLFVSSRVFTVFQCLLGSFTKGIHAGKGGLEFLFFLSLTHIQRSRRLHRRSSCREWQRCARQGWEASTMLRPKWGGKLPQMVSRPSVERACSMRGELSLDTLSDPGQKEWGWTYPG